MPKHSKINQGQRVLDIREAMRGAQRLLAKLPGIFAMDNQHDVLQLARDHSCIRRVGPEGIITTVADMSVLDCSREDGPTLAEQLNFPYRVAMGPDGSLYIADAGYHRIRRVKPDRIITIVAGTGTPGCSGDGGPAPAAQLNFPSGLAVGPDGSLYIADRNNHRIRRITPDGVITTVAGIGTMGFSGDGGPAPAAQLNTPFGVAVEPGGSLYIADGNTYRLYSAAANSHDANN